MNTDVKTEEENLEEQTVPSLKFRHRIKRILIVIVSAVIIICTSVAGIKYAHKLEQYSTAIDYVCAEQYKDATDILADYSDDFKEVDNIRQYINIRNSFDKRNREQYKNILAQLNLFPEFIDERLETDFNDFKMVIEELQAGYEADLLAAKGLIDRIDSIDIENITLEDRAAVNEIRADFNKSTMDVQSLVSNIRLLQSAERELLTLEKYQKQANELVESINQIGEVTLNNGTGLSDLKAEYDKLPEQIKKTVTNIDILNTDIEQYNNLVKQEELRKQQEEEKRQAELRKQAEQKQNNTNAVSGTYYWVNNEIYHTTTNCPTLRRSKHISSGSSPGGRRACKVCG